MKTKIRCTTVGKEYAVLCSQPTILFCLRNKLSAGYVTCNDMKISQNYTEERAQLDPNDRRYSDVRDKIVRLNDCSIAYHYQLMIKYYKLVINGSLFAID